MARANIKDLDLFADFSGSVRVISDEELTGFGISKANCVSKAKSLLPDDFDASGNVDIMPVVFNLAKVNEFNANGDGISTEDAMKMVKRFANKPFNIEHKKQKIVGHIINASFSDKEPEFEDNDIEDFKDRTDPFFINAVAVIYRHIYPKLGALIAEASDSENENYQSISTSWEVAFKDWVIAKGSLKLSECEIITDETEKAKLKKFVKKFGGKGVDDDGVPVNRLLKGKMVPLGGALTYNPAAKVKGVYLLEDEDKENEDEDKEEENSSIENNFQKNDKKSSLITKNIVKIKKIKETLNMDEKQFEKFLSQIEQSVASVMTEESQAKSVGQIFKDALTEQGKSWASKIDAEKAAKEKLEKDLKDTSDSLASIQDEFKQLKTELETKAAVEVFNTRMNYLDDKFELSEKELEIVTAEVKSLASDETAFEAYKGKLETLFAHKTKEAIASREKEIQDKVDAEIAKRLQTSTASTQVAETETEDEIETEVATASIPNNNAQTATQESTIEKLKKNFSVEISN